MTTRRLVDPGVKRLWDQLEDEEFAMVKERRRLQEIWKQITAMHKANEEARADFEKRAAFDFVPPDERVTLNVGGQLFETTAGVLCRDRYSFLAAICKTKPPVSKDRKGAFFFDRDWWIFRYILQFLRSGELPEDHALLREIYDEASFYRLNSLRRATEWKAAEVSLAAGRARTPVEAREAGTNVQQNWRSAGPAPPEVPSLHAFGQQWRSTAEPAGPGRRAEEGKQWAVHPNPHRAPPLPDPYGFRGK